MKNIDKILEKLGGIVKYQEETNSSSDVLSFEKDSNFKLPTFFKDFMISYAPFKFEFLVKKKMEPIKGSYIQGNLLVDYFYSFNKKSKYSISKLTADYEVQIDTGIVPFCDGEAGDLFCISLLPNQYGEIYYFNHEASNERLIKVSNSFEDFIKDLIVEKDLPQDISNWKLSDEVKENSTGEFLNLLEKWKEKNRSDN